MMPDSSAPTEPRRSILRRRQPPPITPLSPDVCQRLPSEVIHIIIERIANFDVPTLRACSLVCQSWLPISRWHLIPTVSLGPKNIKSFLRLLESPYSTISQSIHHVSIQSDSNAISHRKPRESRIYPPDLVASPDGSPLTCDETLLRRLTLFPALTSISFSWLREGLALPTSNVLIEGFPGLTKIEFRTCTFPSFEEFTHVICALQNLRHLALMDVTWDELALPESPIRQALPSHLETLELYLSPIGHICTWIAAHSDDLKELQTISLCSAFWEDLDSIAIAWMLRRLGPKVKHLSLPWHLPEGTSWRLLSTAFEVISNGYLIYLIVDLSHHTELRTLRISHLWFKPIPDNPAEECFTAKGIEKTLLQLNSYQIRNIDFRVLTLFQLTGNELGLDWEKMWKILSRKCFAQLQSVTFGLSAYDKRLRLMLKKIWGGSRQMEIVDDPRRHSRRSGRRLTKLQVDEVIR
ncbi:hypothetical protein C0995_008646 [Termitomyces sp. Mi166|nr:hypothetical protein C0995_008646 [Termitomyces sp. Mi166\